MPKDTPTERAQKTLDRVDARIDALEERKQNALGKVEEQYSTDLANLRAERAHAASHPALATTETIAD